MPRTPARRGRRHAANDPARSDLQHADQLLEVLLDRLSIAGGAADRARGLLDLLPGLDAGRRRRTTAILDPELISLLTLIAGDAEVAGLAPELARYQQRAAEMGVPREAIPEVLQAYVRGVGRVVGVEATTARRVLDNTPVHQQPRVLSALLDDLTPISVRSFDLLHRVLLLEALATEIVARSSSRDDAEVRAIATVDLVGSTRYLTTIGPDELETLVDVMFAAGQAAVSRHAVRVFKHAGDGLFLIGHSVLDTADAALEIISDLELALPLRARGGIDLGPVLERAGDVFGLPVNVAHITCASAPPGKLLATSAAAAHVPAARRGRYRTVRTSSDAVGRARVATIRQPGVTQPGTSRSA